MKSVKVYESDLKYLGDWAKFFVKDEMLSMANDENVYKYDGDIFQITVVTAAEGLTIKGDYIYKGDERIGYIGLV